MLEKVRVPRAGALTNPVGTGDDDKWALLLQSCPNRERYPAIDGSLSDLLRIARMITRDLKYKRENLALYHFAARQDWWPGCFSSSEGGEVASFVVANEDAFGIRYRAFDPTVRRKLLLIPDPITNKGVRDLTLKSFADLQADLYNQLTDRKRLPIIFSFNSFYGDGPVPDSHFWKLAGFQFHRGKVVSLGGSSVPAPKDLKGNEESFIAELAAFVQKRYALDDPPVIELTADGRYRMWWCNTKIGAAPSPKGAEAPRRMRAPPRYDEHAVAAPAKDGFPRFM